MRNADLWTILEGHELLKDTGKVTDMNINMDISRNKRVLKREIDLFNDMKAPSKEFTAWEAEAAKLAGDYAEIDPAGRPKSVFDERTKMNGIKIDEAKRDDFNKAITKLSETKKWKQVIKDRKDQIDNYNKMILEDVREDLLIFKFKIKDLEKLKLPTHIIDCLFEIIE